MLSDELNEAQNSTLFVQEGLKATGDDLPDSVKSHSAMLLSQFEETYAEFLNAQGIVEQPQWGSPQSIDLVHQFIDIALKDFGLRSYTATAELCAVLAASKENPGTRTKDAFALTADNEKTLQGLRDYTRHNLHYARTSLLKDPNAFQVVDRQVDQKTYTLGASYMHSEEWGQLNWAAAMLENPDHPVHAEFRKNPSFHLGPALECAIVPTRQYMEFYYASYLYFESQAQKHGTVIAPEQKQFYTSHINELCIVIGNLCNLSCNNLGLSAEHNSPDEIQQVIKHHYGELRLH